MEPQERQEEDVQNSGTANTRPWLKYAVTAGAGTIAVLLVVWYRGGFASGASGMDRLMAWCDGLFIVGMLLACFGGLMFVSKEGAFDGISYAVRSFTWLFTVKKDKKESYADFKARRREKKRSFLHLVAVGGLFLAVAGVLNYIFISKIG